MDLQKLFETQAKLDARILDKHPELKGQDNLDWKVLALQVELSECANEWRGFKKWSNDQKPRTSEPIACFACNGTGDANYEWIQEAAEGGASYQYEECEDCGGTGYDGVRNPLLEEYVDCLHFILSIGLELKQPLPQGIMQSLHFTPYNAAVTSFFIEVNSYLLSFYSDRTKIRYARALQSLLTLGAALSFTWDEIEQAYYSKNQVNHARQDGGY